MAAWGRDSSGQTNVPANLAGVAAIAGGSSRSVALIGNGPPRLIGPWIERSVLYGATACLEVAAAGAGPLSYQWLHNGTNLPPATNAVLVLNNVQLAQAGSYSVIVSNALGAITNSNLQLDVMPVMITAQPQSQSTFVGGTATFGVSAAGYGQFSYQWQFNGTNLPGATDNVLLLTNVQPEQAGPYTVTVSDSLDSVPSASAVLSVTLIAAWGANWYGQTNVPILTNLVAVASGYDHILGLNSDGTVVAWGAGTNNTGTLPYYGQCVLPPALTNVAAIASGAFHSLALKTDGTVAAWGQNLYGQTNVPAGLSNVVALAGGGDHNLALRADGTVVAWGLNANGQATVPGDLMNVLVIAAGGYHSLVLKADGTVVAWGAGKSNTGVSPNFGQAIVPAGLTNVIAIAAGDSHSLALKADGTVVAWGYNNWTQTSVPPDLTNVVAIAAGAWHSLALKADGTIVAWGYNTDGETKVPASVGHVIGIAGGAYHTVALIGWGPPRFAPALAQGAMPWGATVALRAVVAGAGPLSYQWLFNKTNLPAATNAILVISGVNYGSAGAYSLVVSNAHGSATSPAMAVQVFPLLIAVQPESQRVLAYSTVALNVIPVAEGPYGYQWTLNGANLAGATSSSLVLTNSQPSQSGTYAVLVTNSLGRVQSVDANVVIQQIAAWGYDTEGETNIPPGLTNVLAITSGGTCGVALTGDGCVAAWGDNTWGETNVPPGLSHVVAVASHGYHVLALRSDGTVVAWGQNGASQTNVPAGLANVVAIAAGGSHSLALKADHTVVSWGSQTTVPSNVTNVVAIAAGASHSLALRGDRTVVAWGANGYKQANVPTGLTNVVAVAAGDYHSLAVKGDGTVVAWGAGEVNNPSDAHDFGQSIVPTGLSNVVAVAGGGWHSLALKADGTVVVWGRSTEGQANVPAGLTNVIAIAAGWGHNLALIGCGAVSPTLRFDASVAAAPMTNGAFRLRVIGCLDGRPVVLYASTNLVSWTPLSTNSPTLDWFEYLDSSALAYGARFYRAQQQ